MHGGAEQSGAAAAWEMTRRRAIEVARSLALSGGLGAVRMRDVARLTGISEPELYRHFSSSEHLMVLAQHDWQREAMLASPLPCAPVANGGDRVAELVHRSILATAAAPRFVAAVLASLSTVDPAVRSAHHASTREMSALLRDAVGDELEAVDEYIALLGVTWLGAVSAWTLGNISLGQADRLTQRTARLLFRSMMDEQNEPGAEVRRA